MLTGDGRYTLTYTPSADRIIPAPQHLHVKIRNTSAIPLRAAYLHGPYTLYVACYPSTFDPNKKHENHEEEGAPDFEPNLKAGGQWSSKLSVPKRIRDAAGSTPSRQSLDGNGRSFSWIIEVTSQVIFSMTATVHYEILVGRDERSVELGFYPNAATGQGAPGKLEDHVQARLNKSAYTKGIYSRAVRLAVQDTASLWNSPPFPTWEDEEGNSNQKPAQDQSCDGEEHNEQEQQRPARKKQKIHLVIVTHGIHSNTGADMLYIKESIDATARQARKEARIRKAEIRSQEIKQEEESKGNSTSVSIPETAAEQTSTLANNTVQDDDDDEQVIVRGFTDNVVRTERGIQYLGKRLAKYVLSITYPDQPCFPVKSSISKTIARSLTGQKSVGAERQPTHKNSSIHKDDEHIKKNRAYQITSISFIGHSLGGLTQTYAIAYIKKHSPKFFETIKPISFVAMASPFLGLSNENPIYVKFALDFGLVGRTGQDLGLTWRAPTMVRSGWGAMIGGLGNDNQKGKTEPDPGAKPLLRVLPTGPAHAALKLFRNRSVYSNVVNDGIVPLRTSCLLFLDWRGLGRVEKARRENGLVGTMVGWGWAEMTGQNASSPRGTRPWTDFFGDSGEESDIKKKGRQLDHEEDVPQPSENAMNDDNMSARDVPTEPQSHQFIGKRPFEDDYVQQKSKQVSSQQSTTAWSGFLSLFKPQAPSNSRPSAKKHSKIYHRGQTRLFQDTDSDSTDTPEKSNASRKPLVRGPSLYSTDSGNEEVEAPPKTTFFESAGDLLNPPLPSQEFILDPASRPRIIFHDRIYHPEDIPPPAVKQTRSMSRRSLSPMLKSPSKVDTTSSTNSLTPPSPKPDTSDMKIEEKIARAYHHDLSWRKVLVRLEPDAHNNIVVRRMFANAYGWPVVKHMCDTHFGFTAAATTEDSQETNAERARGTEEPVNRAEQVRGQRDPPDTDLEEGRGREHAEGSESLEKISTQDLDRLGGPPKRTDSEIREATDEVPDMGVTSAIAESSMSTSVSKSNIPFRLSRQDSARWSDRFFDVSDDDSDLDYLQSPFTGRAASLDSNNAPKGTSDAEIADFLGHQATTSPKGSSVSPKPLVAEKFTSPPRPLRSSHGDGETGKNRTTTGPKEDAVVPEPGTLGLTGLGLGTSVEEQVSGGRTGKRRKSLPEQVALATSTGAEREDEQEKNKSLEE